MADCPKCGLSITEGMKFCPECGANLSELLQHKPLGPPTEPTQKGVEMEPKQEPLPPSGQEVPWNQQILPPTEIPRQDLATRGEPPVKKKSKKLVYAVFAIIIAAVIIFAALYIGFRGKKDSPFAGITDADNDGVNDDKDAFPNDSTQWADRDGDNYGDNPNGINPDAFPDDPFEWKDSDKDGIGDNTDIYDSGNGGIYFKVLYYNGDSHPDEGGGGDELDPYFTIWIDLDGDTNVDDNEKSVSQLYDNYDELVNPHSWEVDVPDDIEYVNLGVYVYDNDIWSSDDIIDVSPSEDAAWQYYVYYPATQSSSIQYDCDGSDDNVDDEEDAFIECEYGVKKII